MQYYVVSCCSQHWGVIIFDSSVALVWLESSSVALVWLEYSSDIRDVNLNLATTASWMSVVAVCYNDNCEQRALESKIAK